MKKYISFVVFAVFTITLGLVLEFVFFNFYYFDSFPVGIPHWISILEGRIAILDQFKHENSGFALTVNIISIFFAALVTAYSKLTLKVILFSFKKKEDIHSELKLQYKWLRITAYLVVFIIIRLSTVDFLINNSQWAQELYQIQTVGPIVITVIYTIVYLILILCIQEMIGIARKTFVNKEFFSVKFWQIIGPCTISVGIGSIILELLATKIHGSIMPHDQESLFLQIPAYILMGSILFANIGLLANFIKPKKESTIIWIAVFLSFPLEPIMATGFPIDKIYLLSILTLSLDQMLFGKDTSNKMARGVVIAIALLFCAKFIPFHEIPEPISIWETGLYSLKLSLESILFALIYIEVKKFVHPDSHALLGSIAIFVPYFVTWVILANYLRNLFFLTG